MKYEVWSYQINYPQLYILIGSFNLTYFCDILQRRAWAKNMQTTTANATIKAVKDIMLMEAQRPEECQLDNGCQFKAHEFKYGIT